MKELTSQTLLAKWLKKAKLRDGSNSVGFTIDGVFFYRGFWLGDATDDGVVLKYPARADKTSMFLSDKLLFADPKFFTKLRKALRESMTAINAVSINIPGSLGGRQQPTTKR